jgi:hypothetical protein
MTVGWVEPSAADTAVNTEDSYNEKSEKEKKTLKGAVKAKVHCCYTIATKCNTVVTLLLHCCYNVENTEKEKKTLKGYVKAEVLSPIKPHS